MLARPTPPQLLFAVASGAGHDYPGHAECAARVPAILDCLAKFKLTEDPRVQQLEAFEMVSLDLVLPLVHQEKYLTALERLSNTVMANGQQSMVVEPSPTYLTATSYNDALLAAGAVTALVDEVMAASNKEETPIGFAIARPPGHHAVPAQAMGFCLINNAAVAARHAQQVHGLKKIAIFDFDVHHGNGTSDVFEADDSVLFISTHQDGSYPNTGKIGLVGIDDGQGYTINIPIPGDSGNLAAAMTWEELIEPALRRFQPELILVSAGFDAHWLDPLAGLQYRNTTYHMLAERLVKLAEEICNKRLVFLLEGGYDLKGLSESVVNVFNGVLGEAGFDTLNVDLLRDEPLDKVKAVVSEVRRIHSL